MAYCVHHVPGRVRFKVPQLQRDPGFAGEIEHKVRALDGVTHVEVNRPAWSVIVHYDTATNPLDDIVMQIGAQRPANGVNGNRVDAPSIVPRSDGHSLGGREISGVVGQAIGQAIFATLVQRTIDRSLVSILSGLR